MSTRGAIARLDRMEPPHFTGRYVHWDCYPTGLGAALWDLYHGHFARDLDAMLKVLIDEHPAGWSSLCGCDFSSAPGFREKGATSACPQARDEALDAPQCYCHGDRHEQPQLITQANAAASGCEWVYGFLPSLACLQFPSGVALLSHPRRQSDASPGNRNTTVESHWPHPAQADEVRANAIGEDKCGGDESGPAGSELGEEWLQTDGHRAKIHEPRIAATGKIPSTDNTVPRNECVGRFGQSSICGDEKSAVPRAPSPPCSTGGYRLIEPVMVVLSSFTRQGDKMIGLFGCGDPQAVWRAVAVLDLNGSMPIWDNIEAFGRRPLHAGNTVPGGYDADGTSHKAGPIGRVLSNFARAR